MASLSTSSDAAVIPPLMMQQSLSATPEELRGQKKMMGTTNQYTGIIYTSYNLGIFNNKAEVVSVFYGGQSSGCTSTGDFTDLMANTLDLNRTRFWQLTINCTHGLMSQCRKENASPNQTRAEL